VQRSNPNEGARQQSEYKNSQGFLHVTVPVHSCKKSRSFATTGFEHKPSCRSPSRCTHAKRLDLSKAMVSRFLQIHHVKPQGFLHVTVPVHACKKSRSFATNGFEHKPSCRSPSRCTHARRLDLSKAMVSRFLQNYLVNTQAFLQATVPVNATKRLDLSQPLISNKGLPCKSSSWCTHALQQWRCAKSKQRGDKQTNVASHLTKEEVDYKS